MYNDDIDTIALILAQILKNGTQHYSVLYVVHTVQVDVWAEMKYTIGQASSQLYIILCQLNILTAGYIKPMHIADSEMLQTLSLMLSLRINNEQVMQSCMCSIFITNQLNNVALSPMINNAHLKTILSMIAQSITCQTFDQLRKNSFVNECLRLSLNM